MAERAEREQVLVGLARALARALDVDALRAEVAAWLDATAPPVSAAPSQGAPAEDHASQARAPVAAAAAPEGEDAVAEKAQSERLASRLVLADVLDDGILGARPGDRSFPLRALFAELGQALGDDAAFTLATGMSFYFRAPMDEETKMRVGLEVSALYYAFAASRLDALARAKVSPLLAALMNAELSRVRFESVDHATTFDSLLHERAAGADDGRAAIVRPASFLCRVASTGAVRARAKVLT